MPTLAFFPPEASYAAAQSSYVNRIETVVALLVIAGLLLAAAVFKKYLDRAVIVTDLGTIVRLSLKMVLLAAIAIVSFWIVLTH